MYQYQAKILRVVDGDTFLAEVDLGFNLTAKLRFRLRGIDTPETFRPKTEAEKELGLKAKQFVAALISDKTVTLKTYKEGFYNRWEADCILADGSDLKAHLIQAGLVKTV